MNKRMAGLAYACLFCLVHHASAAVNGWTSMGPEGGTVNKVVFSRDGRSAFAIAAGGFFRSLDAGATWQLVRADFPSTPFDLALDPVDPNRLYVVAPSWPSLYVSSDGGATLSPATTLPTAMTQAMQVAVSADGQALYVATAARILRSPDRGQTWQAQATLSMDPAGRVSRLVVDPTDANTLYAVATTSATAQGVLGSHDGGATWQPLLFAPAPYSTGYAYDVAINNANPQQLWVARSDGLWASADRGAHWSTVDTRPVSRVVVDSANPSILYSGGSGYLYRSPDSGATWTDITGNLLAGEVYSLAIDPSRHTHLLVGGLSGMAGSTVSGSTWSVQQAGLVSTFVVALSADPAADRIYIDVPPGGIYYSTAGSPTVTSANNAGLAQWAGQPNGLYVDAMLVQPGTIWVAQVNGVSRSLDGGSTWLAPLQVPPTAPYQLLAMVSAPSAPQVILAATFNALYRSTDGGALWYRVTAGLPAGSIGPVFMGDADPSVAYAYVLTGAADTGLYRSTDAGLTWAPASANPAGTPNNLFGMDPVAANVLYGASDTALLKSTDGGATWSAMAWDRAASLGYPSVLAVDPVRPQTLYAAAGTRVARSVDGGTTWETLRDTSAVPAWIPTRMLVDPKRPANLLLGTANAGVQQLTVAPDLSLQADALANPVPIGAAHTYTYTASNLGPFDATGVTVTLQLPADAQGVSATLAGGTCTVAGNTVTCSTGILRTGGSAAIALTTTQPAAGGLSIAGFVQGDQPDSVAQNNSTLTAFTVAPVADLSVSVTGTASAQVGGPVSYTLTVQNAGPNPAPTATVSFQFAGGLTPGAVTSTNGTCTTANGLATCTLSDLPATGSATITAGANAAMAGQQVSTATIASATSDPVAGNNTVNLTTTVSAPPSSGGGGGGGGGGAFSTWALLLLAVAGSVRRRRPLSGPAQPPGA